MKVKLKLNDQSKKTTHAIKLNYKKNKHRLKLKINLKKIKLKIVCTKHLTCTNI